MTTLEATAGPSDRHLPVRLLVWVGVLLAVMAAGFAAWLYQLDRGLEVTAMRDNVMWGLYIVTFMFFVGLSAGGLIVASAGRLFGVTRFAPIARLAALEATVAVIAAASFIVPDLGHPERLLNLLLLANLTSPMIWDITIIVIYLVLSVLYVWLYTRRDLAARGSRLALGVHDTPAGRERDHRLTGVLAWFALPAAVLVHSVTAWIFGLQISRGFWYTAIMAPMFVSSALVSGLSLVLLLAVGLRRLRRVVFDDKLVGLLGGTLGVFIVVQAFLVVCEVLAAAYPGVNSDPMRQLLTGQYAPLFAFEVVVGLAIPFALLVVRRLRMQPAVVATAAALALVGIYVHRMEIILVGLGKAPLPYGPGTPLGTAAADGTSFAVTSSYAPTAIEYLVAAGLVAFAALIFTAGVLVLPLRHEVTE
jgi:molybdopterin-containing oxidoreductase family membrane subunit